MVREMMALRATAEPRLMRLMTTPKRKETMTALRGMGKLGETCRILSGGVRLCCYQRGLVLRINRVEKMMVTRGLEKVIKSVHTFDKKGEKGKPPSRAKDQICRDAVAISAITAHTKAMIMMATMMSVPA